MNFCFGFAHFLVTEPELEHKSAQTVLLLIVVPPKNRPRLAILHGIGQIWQFFIDTLHKCIDQ